MSRRVAGVHGVHAIAGDRQGQIYALDAAGRILAATADSSPLWKMTPLPKRPFFRLTAGDACAYASAADGLHAVAQGRELWHVAERATDTPPTLDARGNVYWVGRRGAACEIVGASSQGRIVCRARVPGELEVRELTAASPDAVYALCSDAAIRCFDAAGELTSTFAVRAAERAVLAQDGSLYVPGLDGALYSLDGDGEIRWKLPLTHEGSCNAPAIAGDGTVYVTSTDGRLAAVD
jgi:outer membrane protein assembly factor BamB